MQADREEHDREETDQLARAAEVRHELLRAGQAGKTCWCFVLRSGLVRRLQREWSADVQDGADLFGSIRGIIFKPGIAVMRNAFSVNTVTRLPVSVQAAVESPNLNVPASWTALRETLLNALAAAAI